jgi:putative hemolysin
MAYFEILLVVALTILNGLLAMSELAIASSRMPKLRALAEQRVAGAKRAMALASDPGRFLSTVQIGITLIGILAGVVSGAALGERTSLWFRSFGLSETVSEALGYGAVISLITYVSLIIGELVPKQIALQSRENCLPRGTRHDAAGQGCIAHRVVPQPIRNARAFRAWQGWSPQRHRDRCRNPFAYC